MSEQTFENFMGKTIYFPSNGKVFIPKPNEYPITHNQAQEIRTKTNCASRRFRGDEQIVTTHIYNKLRVIFCVQVIEDIPRKHFDKAIGFIDQAWHEIIDFECFITDLHKMFAVTILKGDNPWTPAVKSNWCNKLAKELPERPDWQELAEKIRMMQTDSKFLKRRGV